MSKFKQTKLDIKRGDFPETIQGTEDYYKAKGEYEDYLNGINKEDIINQFRHIFNLGIIFTEKRLNDFENMVLDKGFSYEHMKIMRDSAMRQSNWQKESFIENIMGNKRLNYTKVVR